MMEEIVQTSESHHQKNYLAKVNKWYKKKQLLIDDELLKKRMPPPNFKPTLICRKEYKRQMSMKKKNKELEKESSSVKRIKIEKSPLNKSNFPPISKASFNLNSGGSSPFKKYYEDQPSRAQKNNPDNEDSFTQKIISLKRTTEDYHDSSYMEALGLKNRKGIAIWKKHREKKVSMNRSQDQLQRRVKKWGASKSFHHARALMVADRHKIIYNNHSRSYKKKPKSPQKDSLSNSLFMNHDKFLDVDNDSLESSDEENFRRKIKNNNNDYSFNDSDDI